MGCVFRIWGRFVGWRNRNLVFYIGCIVVIVFCFYMVVSCGICL